MDGFSVIVEVLERCRTEVAGQAGPMAAAADNLPAGLSAGSFGGLEGGGALADAVNALTEKIGGEIGNASERLGQVSTALEAVIDTVRQTDQNSARTLAPA